MAQLCVQPSHAPNTSGSHPPPSTLSLCSIVAPHLANRDPVMQVRSAGIVPPRVGGGASLTVVPAAVPVPAAAAAAPRVAAPPVAVASAAPAPGGLPAGWAEVTTAEGET